MFERPPYITCPFCGKETFGVLMVTGDSYVRRCAACSRPKGTEKPARYDLPPLGKKILYLDQFAIRKVYHVLANEKNPNSFEISEEWATLVKKILYLVQTQLIICPISDIHIHESLVWKDYEGTRRVLHRLSSGVRFLSRFEIEKKQILHNAQNWADGLINAGTAFEAREALSKDPNFWPDLISVSAVLSPPEEYIEQIRSIRDEAHVDISNIFGRWQTQKDKDFWYWFDEEMVGFIKVMFSNLKAFYVEIDENNYTPLQKLNMIGAKPTLDIFFSLISLFEKYAFSTEGACKMTSEYLQSGSLKDVPSLKINALLWASMALKAATGQKNPPNRGTLNDVEFISAYLPYCDAMMIDNVNHSYLNYEPLKSEIGYGTKLFSLNNIDEFIAYLNQIESEATPEHWAALEEVYGIYRD